MRVSVIISTYNSPAWLEKVIWGYENQTYKNFELVIADDGSGEETRNLIEYYRNNSEIDILHVWQKDEGFQKSRILNMAVVASRTDYLIFSDGDCIPRNDFIEKHVQYARPGKFLSGGYFKLPMETSLLISREDVQSQRAFDVRWLYAHGLEKTYKSMKLTSRGFKEKFMNFITPATATWNGHNSSGWKTDVIAVNGYDERMQYGGQDREMGERLMNKGIKGVQIRYSAICVHLDHKRGYNTAESINKNVMIRQETKKQRKIWTESGIRKSASLMDDEVKNEFLKSFA